MRNLLVIAMLLAVTASLASCPKPPAQENAQVSTPDTAQQATAAPASGWAGKDFTLANFGGADLKLSSLAGKPVVLNFWADW